MTVSVSIQETTIVPANGGYDVRLYISDKPRDALDAELVLNLRAQIGPTKTPRLQDIQKAALDEIVEALKPLMSDLY
jgi:hypothetical protein